MRGSEPMSTSIGNHEGNERPSWLDNTDASRIRGLLREDWENRIRDCKDLSLAQAETLYLHFALGLPQHEVAHRLGKSKSAISGRIKRGLVLIELNEQKRRRESVEARRKFLEEGEGL